MSRKIKLALGVVAAAFLAAEPLMTLWQPLLPQGSYAAIATFIAIIRAGLVYYTSKEPVEPEEDEHATVN